MRRNERRLEFRLTTIILIAMLLAIVFLPAFATGDVNANGSDSASTSAPEDQPSPIQCAAFCMLDSNGHPIIGSNAGLSDDIWVPGGGWVMVNKRNVLKTGVDLITDQQPAKWISKYGSITINTTGREFAGEGVNEAGLMVQVLALISASVPPEDSRPYVLGWLQWAQYQLDNSSTVEEVIASNSIIRTGAASAPDAPQHVWVCDRTGDSAVIEFYGGEMHIHSTTGEPDMPYPAITNSSYEESVSYLSQFEGFGGDDPIPDESANDSLSRFVQAAYWMQEYDGDSDPIDYTFNALDYIGQDITVLKVVYDLHNLRIYFHTRENSNIGYLDLDSFDFSCETPVTMLDVKTSLSGDVSDDFIIYDPEANHRMVEALYNYAYAYFGGTPPEGLIDTISQYPESTYPLASDFKGPAGPEGPQGDDASAVLGIVAIILAVIAVILVIVFKVTANR